MSSEAAAVLAALFISEQPRPELAEHMALFEPLIGSWDLVVQDFDADGHRRLSLGEWHFSWALDGRAVADVWICPRRDAPENANANRSQQAQAEWGTSIRFYDQAADMWRSTWIGPGRAMIRQFTLAPTTDGLQLTGHFAHQPTTLWTFSSMTGSTFTWRNEDIDRHGIVRLRQTFDATRADAHGNDFSPQWSQDQPS